MALAAGCVDVADTPPEDDGDGDVADDGTGDRQGYEVEAAAEGFSHPWALEFVPDSRTLLVTERDGRLNAVDRDTGEVTELEGVPEVYARGQGGLLDVELHPDYPEESWIYLTYSTSVEDGSTTALGRGQLDLDGGQVDGFERLFTAEPLRRESQHYGSRVTFDDQGFLYVSVGDRGSKEFSGDHPSRDPANDLGAVHRLTADGDVPGDNPFVDDASANDTVYTYGHRNNQGLAVHPETGAVWTSEHGEEDGDEINVLEAGGDYGWPEAHTGCHYGTSEPVGDIPFDRDDVVDPVHHWECNTGGYPPAGMTFYTGDAFTGWRGDLFVGNLAGRYLGRFTVDGGSVEEQQPLLDGRGWRIRDVEESQDTGYLYVAVDTADAPVVRLAPA